MDEKGKNNKQINHNKELAVIFKRMADCYKFMGSDQRFRATAYDTVSKTLSNLKEPVDVYGDDIKKLDELKGVGESIAAKIIEYLQTGKIKTFEELKKKVPYKLLDLMAISGIGPATIRYLYEQFGIKTKDELINLIEEGKLEGVKGFGKRKIENLKTILKVAKREHRIAFTEAEKISTNILNAIVKIPGVIKATVAGSIRRKKETIGDIDIVIVAAQKNWKKIINKFIKLPFVREVKASGETKTSVIIKDYNMQVDIRIVHDFEYGAALFYFTGSKEHNIKLRTLAKQHGWKINEYGVFEEKTGKRLAGETEQQIYDLFGLPFIPPEKRIGAKELDSISFQPVNG
jgi:DNA polymerase (family 10)